ncbi:hypothetical protein QC823_16160, partial [Halomonas vilamensis]
ITVADADDLVADGANDPFNLSVTVTDNEGATASDSITVEVLAAGEVDLITEDLDALGGTITTAESFDAGVDAYRLKDDVASESNTEVSNFGSDDALEFVGVTAGDVQVSVADGNTIFQFDDGAGTVSEVALVGVSGFFTNVAEFNASADYGDVTFA